jgi:hypothetical protein
LEQNSDAAMYELKEKGKNGYGLFNQENPVEFQEYELQEYLT